VEMEQLTFLLLQKTNLQIEATNGINTIIRMWSAIANNDNNILDFNIGFASPIFFADLTDDWDIISRTDIKIELIDASGGHGGTDYLTFEKN